MNIRWVNKDDAEKIWPNVEPYLISAMKKWLPVYFSCDLLDMVKKDEAQLWIITNDKEEQLYGAGLTQIVPYPRARIMNLFLFGGRELKKWRKEFPAAVEVFARSQKCDFMQSIGRRGWAWFPGCFESAIVVNKILT